MKAASLQEIKSALNGKDPRKLEEVCLRLAKHKKENKELLSFLLFEADNVPDYINSVKSEMDYHFREINTSNIYFAKKSFRKILRITNKHIRFISDKSAEAELLIHFCQGMRGSGIDFSGSAVVKNIYEQQKKKILAAVATLHEDLQFDFQENLNVL